MKKFFSFVIITTAVFSAITKNICAQNANTSLSNLVKTKINQNLFPKTTNTYNLGSDDSAWKSLFLTGSIYLDKQRFISNPGINNNFIGTNAGKSLTTGEYNTAVGVEALYSNKIGWENTAVGKGALFSNTGFYNTATGYAALNSNIDGDYNTSFGVSALNRNTSASYNTALGADVLYNNTSGEYNTAAGAYAMYSNTGNYNTGFGYYTLEQTTGAYYNTAVGYSAGFSHDNGYNNVFIGANTDVNGDGYYNVIAIGQGTICTDVSQARFGNSSTTSIGGYANWTNISDGRVKKNIKQNVPGLAFINKLKPVTYNLDLDAIDKIIQFTRKDLSGKIMPLNKIEQQARLAKEKIIYTGFVAQDVEAAAKSLNYDFSGVDAAKNDKSLYGLRYAEFVVPLVKAVQELSKMNDEKDSAINELKSELQNLKSEMENIKTMMISSVSMVNGQQSTVNMSLSSASLLQNVPNPYNHSTSIAYNLPKQFSSAQIVVTDNTGKTLKTINVSGQGKGVLHLDASTLSAGSYNYSLYVDGKLIDTKKMILSK